MNRQVNQQHLDTCVTATQITVTLHKTISYIRSSCGTSENITYTLCLAPRIKQEHKQKDSWLTGVSSITGIVCP